MLTHPLITIKNNKMQKEFFIAVKRGKVEAVRSLLNKKQVDVNQTDSYGTNALFLAVKKGDLNMVNLLLTYNIHIDHLSLRHQTALSLASEENQIAIVKRLLDSGAKHHIAHVLVWAIKEKHKDLMTDEYKDKALFEAAQQKNKSFIKILLHAGANLLAKNKNNTTSFDVLPEDLKIPAAFFKIRTDYAMNLVSTAKFWHLTFLQTKRHLQLPQELVDNIILPMVQSLMQANYGLELSIREIKQLRRVAAQNNATHPITAPPEQALSRLSLRP